MPFHASKHGRERQFKLVEDMREISFFSDASVFWRQIPNACASAASRV